MCDYSLHAHPNRLAVEGETLITTRFPGGSMGLASQSDLPRTATWDNPDTKPLCAVCIPPGAQLLIEDIPARLKQEFSVSDAEFVTFTQLGFEAYTHRDGIRFENGKEVLLQRLNENQRVRVMSLANIGERIQESATITSTRRVSAGELVGVQRSNVFQRAWQAVKSRLAPQRVKEPATQQVSADEFAHEV